MAAKKKVRIKGTDFEYEVEHTSVGDLVEGDLVCTVRLPNSTEHACLPKAICEEVVPKAWSKFTNDFGTEIHFYPGCGHSSGALDDFYVRIGDAGDKQIPREKAVELAHAILEWAGEDDG